MSTPLAGLRVIDLSSTQAGAPVGQLLADYGADVLMIEPPGGSALRQLPGFPFWARGKRSLELDLKTPEGKARLRTLLASADILIETFRPGVLDRLGLSQGAISALNPRLVHTSITGFGTSGPLSTMKGYEGLVMAKIGGLTPFMPITRRPGPTFVSVPYCSFSASQTALHGTLAALYERETSGLGQHVEASLAQSFAAHDTWNWYVNVITDKYPGAFTPAAAYSEDLVPSTGFYFRLPVLLTKDGKWLQFSQTFPHLFRAFMRVLDLEWMFDDPAWKDVPDFLQEPKRIAFWNVLIERARERTYDDWVAVFDAERDVWAEPFRHGRQLLDHPQLQHDKQVVEVHDPERGVVRQMAPLVRLSSLPDRVLRGAPRVGEGGGEGLAVDPGSDLPGAADGLPLAGVTVLELATMYAGPYASTLLTDLGARVYKVEPLSGDLIRHVLPFPELGGIKVMQGKESIAVDVRTEEGRQIVHDLAKKADLVVQSYRAGVAKRLGVDAETLRSVNPDLIYLNAPGYGADGPCGDRPAFAPNIGAAAGLAMRNAGPAVPEGPELTTEEIKSVSIPLFLAGTPVSAQADGFSALGAATALLLGLYARARGAGSETMVTSMLSTVGHALGDDMVSYDGRPAIAAADDDLWGLHALYRIYPTANGWCFLAAPEDRDWAALVNVLAAEHDFTADAVFATAEGRRHADEALVKILTEVFARRTSAEWEAVMTAADVGCAEVNTTNPERVLMEELGRALGYVADVTHPTYGDHPRLAPLVRFSRSSTTAGPSCLAGQHTDDLLREIGRTDEEIAGLRERGVVD